MGLCYPHIYSCSKGTYPFKGGDDDRSCEAVLTFNKNNTKESPKRNTCIINQHQQENAKAPNETVDLKMNTHRFTCYYN